MSRVTVFLSSSELVSPAFLSEAEHFGQELARAGHHLIYGGANCGMMGHMASAALAAGGRVTGVIPDLDFAQGLNQGGLSEEIVVGTLGERKSRMLAMCDVAVALPGGLGTLDEVFDALVLKVTGEWKKPFYFLNSFDFWTPTLEALTLMHEQRMINANLNDLFEVCANTKELLRAIGRAGVFK